MERRRQFLAVALIATFGLGSAATAQQIGEPPSERGGGPVPIATDRPGVDHDYEVVFERMRVVVDSLRDARSLPAVRQRAVPQLVWPLEVAPHYERFGYYGTSNFVDHDPAFPNVLEDYMCGARTYDTAAGYNHDGVDLFLWPYGWAMMDADDVRVVAAAEGTIIFKRDGHNDRQCTWDHGEPANVIYLAHTDGSMTRYLHLKKDSLTPKGVGETVAAGEYLGIVGSSGISTGPHLHFDVWATTSGGLRDPYAGPCNMTTDISLWEEQPPYYDSGINAIITHPSPPTLPTCPDTQDNVNEQTTFAPGETVYMAVYYRDQRQGQVSQYRVRRPDNSTWFQWNGSLEAPHFAATYWYWALPLPAAAMQGTYTIEIGYEGEMYTYQFTVGAVGNESGGPLLELALDLFPNPVSSRMHLAVQGIGVEPVRAELYDVLGRRVALLHDGVHAGERLQVSYDVAHLAVGQYVVRVEAGGEVLTRRLTILR